MKTFKFLNIFNNILTNKNDLLYRILITFVLFVSIFSLMIFQYIRKKDTVEVGRVLKRDIVADRDIKYIDTKKTGERQKLIKATTPPVYIFNKKLSHNVIINIRKVLNEIDRAPDYYEFKNNKENKSFSIEFDEYQIIKNIINNHSQFIDKYILFLENYYDKGVIKLNESILAKIDSAGIIIGRYENTRLIRTLYSPDEISEYEINLIKNKDLIIQHFSYLNELEKRVILNFFNNSLITNIVYDEELSQLRLNNNLKNQVVNGKIVKGEIFRRGQLIDQTVYDKITAILKAQKNKLDFKLFLFYLLILAAFFFLTYQLINFCDKKFFRNMQNITFLALIIFFYTLFISMPLYLGFQRDNYYYGLIVPISTFSLTFIFLYSKIVSAMLTLILAVFFLILSGFNYISFIFIFFSGMFSLFSVSVVKRRIELLVAGLFIMAINIVIASLIFLIFEESEINLLEYLIVALLNGLVSSILAIGIIGLGEITLNSPTVFRLQELSDASSPLLKELFDTAVGTYNHSILVANLAEAAANEIGVNGLLARVGGYYHDIGKIDNPEYFVENQGDFNIHTQLKPSISVTIIKNHVKKGVERAKKERLPQRVIDIIAQHHGNSLIKYFYVEAVKSADENKEEIQKDLYQYKGINPRSPEAAIVLLADQVEAASRALKKASMTSVEKLIEGIIDERFQEGVLDDSGLTLKDITKIRKVFVKLVLGMYHSRIEYPDKKELKEDHREKVSK